jgi:hypothetical protein
MQGDGISGKIRKVNLPHHTSFEAASHLSPCAAAEIWEVVIRILTHHTKAGRTLLFRTPVPQYKSVQSQHRSTVDLTGVDTAVKGERGINAILNVEPPETG